MADQTALYITVLQNQVESLTTALREAETQRDDLDAELDAARADIAAERGHRERLERELAALKERYENVS